jgi:NAD(P)-dependent dehydrogenase (short-subunit alcohol dehydrogenase family)
MQIQNSVALVTGANRGLGKALVDELLRQGAQKVYAAARQPTSSSDGRIVPLRLDVTDPDQVAQAAALASDVTILINNAGARSGARILDGDLAGIQADLETNFLGVVSIARAFAPILAGNGGGALLEVLSVRSWLSGGDGYSAAKAAAWSATNALRVALRPAGTLVTALHVGYMDTDMTAGLDVVKADPRDVAHQAIEALREDRTEVLADETSRTVKRALSGDLSLLYPAAAG